MTNITQGISTLWQTVRTGVVLADDCELPDPQDGTLTENHLKCERRRPCWLRWLSGAVAFAGLVLYPILLVCRWWRDRAPRPSRFDAAPSSDCQRVPAHVYRRPDPMIYSQSYLQSQGLAVTWINPDVTIDLGGVPVDSGALLPSTTYEVVARIWNGSPDAPAIGLPVQFSYLSFGVGTKSHQIGSTSVDLGAKGAPGCPAFATQTWTTPPVAGHYCLLVELIWADDANPFNNVGQSNTQVKKLNSPHAAFDFEAANLDRHRHVYRFTLDEYALTPRPPCDDAFVRRATPTAEEIRARADHARAEHRTGAFPIPDGWTITVDPAEVVLGPSETRVVNVDVTAPDAFSGSKPINVNAFDEHDRLVGGVTLVVES